MAGCAGCFLIVMAAPIILLALSFGFVVAPAFMAVGFIALFLMLAIKVIRGVF